MKKVNFKNMESLGFEKLSRETLKSLTGGTQAMCQHDQNCSGNKMCCNLHGSKQCVDPIGGACPRDTGCSNTSYCQNYYNDCMTNRKSANEFSDPSEWIAYNILTGNSCKADLSACCADSGAG